MNMLVTPHTADPEASVLNGRWIVTDGVLGGVQLPANALRELTLVLHDGTFALGVDQGRIALDWDVRPPAMDVLVVRGPNRGRFVPAIFEQTERALRICFDLSGRQRPTAFAAPAGTRRFLATYRRGPHPATNAPQVEVRRMGDVRWP